ncbi:MAG: hypothetical protein IKT00_04385 [Prevotella sp.]|nr:hypothetical protein [Prevotella sp.]
MDKTIAYSRRWRSIYANVCMFIVVVLCAGCFNSSGNKKRLRQEIAKANAEFPQETPGIGRVDSVGLVDNDNVVVYYYTVYEGTEVLSVDAVKANTDIVKRKMINTALAGNRESLEIFKRYRVGVRYIFSEENTEKKATVDIPLEEIVRALDQKISKTEAAELALKDDLFMSKQSLPIQIEEGLKIVDLTLDDNQLFYIIDVDEKVYPISSDFDKAAVKEGIIEELNSPAPGMMSTLDNLVKTARGLTFRYVGNKSKRQIDIELSTMELRSVLTNI